MWIESVLFIFASRIANLVCKHIYTYSNNVTNMELYHVFHDEKNAI